MEQSDHNTIYVLYTHKRYINVETVHTKVKFAKITVKSLQLCFYIDMNIRNITQYL